MIDFAEKHHLENLIAIDNTASETFIKHYSSLVENGFDLVSSNKIANTTDFKSYQNLRLKLKEFKRILNYLRQ